MAEEPTITLLAVGDMMLGDLPTSYGFGVGSAMARRGADFPFLRVRKCLERGDLVIGNLECVISGYDRDHEPFERIQLRAQPAAAEALKTAGFDVLSFATNHTMQHGKAAVTETVRLLTSQGMEVCGVDLPDMRVVPEAVLERNGLRIGILNFNLRPQQYFLDPPMWPLPTPDSMLAAVKSRRQDVDLLIVALHWGDEFIDYPSPEQVSLAHRLVDGGVDLILGHHPHIVQGIEQYQRGVIAYSLGNFVFDMWQLEYRRSMILQCTLSRQGVTAYDIIPVMISEHGQPVLTTGTEKDEARRSIHALAAKIPDAEAAPDQYLAEVAGRTRAYQYEVYWHYLRNVYRYPPRRLLENFLGAMRRRL